VRQRHQRVPMWRAAQMQLAFLDLLLRHAGNE